MLVLGHRGRLVLGGGGGSVTAEDIEDALTAPGADTDAVREALDAVPTSRTLADLSLAANRSAADLRTALGVSGDPGMPSTNLVALWRASSLSLSDGDPVSTWAPASGTPGSLTGSGSARPTYRATGSPSGGPAVEFDGSDDELSLSSPAGLPSGAGAGTMVAIVSRAFHNGSLSFIAQFGTGSTAQARGLGLNATKWYLLDYAADLTADTDYDGARHPRGVVLTHWYDGTTRRLMVDGVPVKSSTTTLNTGSSVLHVGRSIYGGQRASFRLMALAIYDAALSDAALAQIQAHARIAHGVP